MKAKIHRRDFLKKAGALSAAAFVLPKFSIGAGNVSANSKVNVAFVGIGGRGSRNIDGIKTIDYANIVGFADVNDSQASPKYKEFPNVPHFRDWRKMLDKLGKDVDAVIISTPDHTHHCIAMDCMKRGKHVYVEKPMCHNIFQGREMLEYARANKIVTQMGNQAHASMGIRMGKEWLDSGIIGKIKEIQTWNVWPISTEKNWYAQLNGKPPVSAPAPKDLDWNIWLGPLAYREYSPAYLPRTWRTFYEMGSGILGDWGCHTLDAPIYGLGLKSPKRVECVMAKRNELAGVQNYANVTHWVFEHDNREIKIKWHDGLQDGGIPPEGSEFFKWTPEMFNGCLICGEKGDIFYPGHPTSCRLYPNEFFREMKAKLPKPSIPRIKGNIYTDFLKGIQGEAAPCSNFEVSEPLTEVVLLGTLSQKTQTSFDWDTKTCKTSSDIANKAMIEEARAF